MRLQQIIASLPGFCLDGRQTPDIKPPSGLYVGSTSVIEQCKGHEETICGTPLQSSSVILRICPGWTLALLNMGWT